MFYTDLQPVELGQALNLSDPFVLRFFCSNPTLRHSTLLQGRPLQLSESSLQLLEVIAAHGRNGLTQAELAKVLGCDSKNAFHWLKSLVANDLIARTPVASKKSFTYLLILTKYWDDEISYQHGATSHSETHNVVSSKEIRQRIVDILAKAPNQTMVSKDVFDQTGLDSLLIKNFRRAATKLNEIGWLEYLFEDQLVGPYCRLFRLKRKPSEGLDLKSFLAAQDEAKRIDSKDTPSYVLPRGSDYRPDHPILHQIISLLADSFPEPLTTSNLSHRLNIPRKYLYKLIDRIIPLPGKKSGVIGAEGIEKVSDFVGKEKRLKLFVKSEEWRNYYLKIFSFETPEAPSSSLPSSRPSTPVIAVTSAQQSPSDTRTRQLRHHAILQELSLHRILEIGKELCHRIQTVLGDTRFTLDLKTLRRSIEILERENKLKVVVASLPTGTRSLLIAPELSASDELVQNYIAKLSETVRSAPLSASTIKLEKLKEAMQQPAYFVEGSLPFGVPQNPSVNARALIQFGFISGVLSRAQLFHGFLLTNSDESFSFETIPTIFEKMPLSLYLNLIGIVRMSRSLYNSLGSLSPIALFDLPEIYRDELGLNRKRFQSQASILLGILEDLKLIQGEEHFASLNFKLPFKYNFAIEVPLCNYKGEIVKIVKFTRDSGFKEFWNGMHQICQDYNSKNISIHSEEDGNAVAKVILLARHNDSWRDKPCRERDLEKAVRKFAMDRFSAEKSQRRLLTHMAVDGGFSLKISELSSEFDVSSDRIATMLENYKNILEEREESRRLAKRNRNEDESSENDDSDTGSDSDGGTDIITERWTQSDWSKLSLAFCILQQPLFLNNSCTATTSSGIKWNLASKVFDNRKSPIIIRRHGLKLFKSYRELAKMVETDSLVRLVLKSFAFNGSHDDLGNLFKAAFDACQDELSQSELICDNFYLQPTDSFEVLSNRQEHYLNTIDSWVQTRSFRHGLLQNQTGMIESRGIGPICGLSATCTLLRQILVYSNSSSSSSFDYDAVSRLIKSIDPSDLSKSIDHLISIGFASRNKARDHKRIFGFPLVVSERVREVIECQEQAEPELSEFTIDNATESLSIKRIEGIIDAFMNSEIEIEILKPNEDLKFDAPIKLTTKCLRPNQNSPIDMKNDRRALWSGPLDGKISAETVSSCSRHLRNSVKAQPGISMDDLKSKYENVLEGFEVDSLTGSLLESKSIERIESRYLQ